MRELRCSQCTEMIVDQPPIVRDCRYFHQECVPFWVERLMWLKSHPDAPLSANPWTTAVPLTPAA